MINAERISQMSHRIFNTSLNEKKTIRENSNNPFAGSKFQKNILTVDTFESSRNNEVKFTGNNITQSTKRIYSTFVGSINDFCKRFYNGIESIKEFGNRMKDGIVSMWNKVQDFGNQEVHPIEGIKNGLNDIKNILSYDVSSLIDTHVRKVNKLSKLDPQTVIKPMFVESLKALEEDLAVAA
ncbi:hypothetical protein J6G99_06110 [bacterium]|nr:hypothetical protein [bacterium]